MANAKTLRKRIALVAAAALGIGALAAAPAFAVASTAVVTIGGITYGGTNTVATANSTITVPVNLAVTPNATYTPSTITAVGVLSGGPNNSTTTVTAATTGAYTGYTAPGTGGTAVSATGATLSYVEPTATASPSGQFGVMTFTPNAPGRYTFTVTPSVAGVAGTAVVTQFNVGGVGFTQALSGLATTSGTQVAGNLSAFVYSVPAGMTVGATYQVTASGAAIASAGYGGTGNLASGVSTWTATTGITKVNPTDYSQGFTFVSQQTTSATASDQISVQLSSPTVGTATVTVKSVNAITGALTTVGTATLTVVAAGSLTVNAANSSLYLGTTGQNSIVSGLTSVNNTANTTTPITAAKGTTRIANVLVNVKDGNSNAISGDTVTVTLSGPGTFVAGTGNDASTFVNPTKRADSVTTDASGNVVVALFGDNTSGVATLTFTDGTVALGAKSVTIYGAIATLTPTVNVGLVANGAASTTNNNNTGAITVVAKDAAGVVIPSGTIYVSSSATTVINDTYTSLAFSGGSASYSPTGGVAGTTNITFTDFGTAATTTVTSAVSKLTVAASQTPASVSIALDKATYAPGEKMTVTLTAKDANGNLLADSGTGTNGYTLLVAGLAASASTTSTLPASTITKVVLVNGVATWIVYAPLVAGPVSINGNSALTGNPALVASATVVAAANSDIAAAKAAADAATAAVATLSTTVASLIASITAQLKALSALVKKIMTKLKIK